MALQLAFVLVAIIIGARLGGIGLGVMGGIGLAILTFGFGLQPTSPPIDVMLMIAAVISAASCMQAAGKAGRTVVAEESFAGHHLEPYCDLFVYFCCRHGTCGIFGASRDCRGCHGDQDSSREATGHCGDCFAAGYYGKSHFGCHRRTAWVAGGI